MATSAVAAHPDTLTNVVSHGSISTINTIVHRFKKTYPQDATSIQKRYEIDVQHYEFFEMDTNLLPCFQSTAMAATEWGEFVISRLINTIMSYQEFSSNISSNLGEALEELSKGNSKATDYTSMFIRDMQTNLGEIGQLNEGLDLFNRRVEEVDKLSEQSRDFYDGFDDYSKKKAKQKKEQITTIERSNSQLSSDKKIAGYIQGVLGGSTGVVGSCLALALVGVKKAPQPLKLAAGAAAAGAVFVGGMTIGVCCLASNLKSQSTEKIEANQDELNTCREYVQLNESLRAQDLEGVKKDIQEIRESVLKIQNWVNNAQIFWNDQINTLTRLSSILEPEGSPGKQRMNLKKVHRRYRTDSEVQNCLELYKYLDTYRSWVDKDIEFNKLRRIARAA